MQILLIGAHIESARVEAKLIVTALLLQGWLQLAPQKSLLVYVREERVIDYVIEIVCTATQSRLPVLVEKLKHDVHELIAIVDTILALVGEYNARLSNLEQEQAPFFVVKWSDTDEHLVNEDAEGPPVHGEIVPLLHNHLRCQILRRPTERLRQVVLWQRLRQPVVNDLEVALLVQQNVLQLQIAVHDSLRVQIPDGEAYLK